MMIDPNVRARLYHAQYQTYEADLPFWLTLARDAGGPILEMGCGTGRLVTALTQLGYHVIGLDHDQAMINRGKAMLDPMLIPSVTWVEQTMTSFTVDVPVALGDRGPEYFRLPG